MATPGSDLAKALDALQKWERECPEHVAWITSGTPPVRSEDDHIRIFGRPYDEGSGTKKKR